METPATTNPKATGNPPKNLGPMLETLGVSVYHLKHVFLETKVCGATNNSTGDFLSRSSTLHDIENLQGPPGVIRQHSVDHISPVDGRKGASYVRCLSGEDHVGEATHMLSYWWGYTIGDIVDALCEYCQTHHLDTRRSYIWIDCLCINQHRVVEQKDTGGTGMLNFEQEFPEQLKKIGHMLAMMAPWEAPVYMTRLWCVFEIYTAHAKGCKVDIVMPPKEKESLEQDVLADQEGIHKLYKALGNVKVQNAKATVPSDRQAIMNMIKNNVGYQVLNNRVNGLLRGWMKYTLAQLVETKEDTNDLTYATFCNSIGTVFARNGEYDSALEQYQKCLTIRESLLGVDHPDTAITYSNIGSVMNLKADYDGALEQYQKCLAIRESKLGREHRETAITYNNIGSVLQDKGNFDGALEQYQMCLSIQNSTLGKDHHCTARTYNNIGSVLDAKRDYDGALEQYRKCLTISEAELGEEHPSTAVTYNNIGSVLDNMGEYDGALQQYRKCLSIQEAVLGTDDLSTAITYNNIGTVLYQKGDYNASLKEMNKSRATFKATLGTKHPKTVECSENIAKVRQKMMEAGITEELTGAIELNS